MAICTLALCAIILLIGVGLVDVIATREGAGGGAAAAQGPQVVDDTVQAVDGITASQVAGERPRREEPPWLGDIENLHHECAALQEPLAHRASALEGFTPRCEAALDSRYLGRRPEGLPISADAYGIDWREVFDDPARKRDEVLAFLSGACVRPGHAASDDGTAQLRDCKIAHIAEFATLKYQCGGRSQHILQGMEPGLHAVLEAGRLDEVEDHQEFWRRRGEIVDAYYRDAWLAAKCASLPDGVLARIGSMPWFRDGPTTDAIIGHEASTGQSGWWWAEQAFEAYMLMNVAAANHPANALPAGEDWLWWSRPLPVEHYKFQMDAIGPWQKSHPLVAEIVELKTRSASPPSAQNTRRQLRHALMATALARHLRIDLDERWLYAHVGPHTGEDFQFAHADAERHMARQGVRLLLEETQPDGG